MHAEFYAQQMAGLTPEEARIYQREIDILHRLEKEEKLVTQTYRDEKEWLADMLTYDQIPTFRGWEWADLSSGRKLCFVEAMNYLLNMSDLPSEIRETIPEVPSVNVGTDFGFGDAWLVYQEDMYYSLGQASQHTSISTGDALNRMQSELCYMSREITDSVDIPEPRPFELLDEEEQHWVLEEVRAIEPYTCFPRDNIVSNLNAQIIATDVLLNTDLIGLARFIHQHPNYLDWLERVTKGKKTKYYVYAEGQLNVARESGNFTTTTIYAFYNSHDIGSFQKQYEFSFFQRSVEDYITFRQQFDLRLVRKEGYNRWRQMLQSRVGAAAMERYMYHEIPDPLTKDVYLSRKNLEEWTEYTRAGCLIHAQTVCEICPGFEEQDNDQLVDSEPEVSLLREMGFNLNFPHNGGKRRSHIALNYWIFTVLRYRPIHHSLHRRWSVKSFRPFLKRYVAHTCVTFFSGELATARKRYLQSQDFQWRCARLIKFGENPESESVRPISYIYSRGGTRDLGVVLVSQRTRKRKRPRED